MKKTTTLLVLCLFTLGLYAQISGALKIGLSGYQGDINSLSDKNIGLFDETNLTFGLGARIPLNKTFGLRADATYIRLSANEGQFENTGHATRGWKLKNDFLEIAASLDWELFGNKRFNENGIFKRVLTPVIFAGVGVAFTNAEVDFNNVSNTNIDTDNQESDKVRFVLPIGLGLKYYISEGFALALEGGIRMPISDYYDGISLAANEGKNDSYGFAGLTASFLLGKKADADGDGIADKKDICPEVPGLVQFDGCPDTDGDGVKDADDKCPQLAGQMILAGCPDTDGDGLEDIKDACPNTPGLVAMNGCPDTDKDGLADADDQCPKMAGSKETFGCPDSDNDGVVDKMDDCPTVEGTPSTRGCPDADADGVADNIDKCPNVAGKMSDGCPETVVATPPVIKDKEVSISIPNPYNNPDVTTTTSPAPFNSTAVSAKLLEASHQIHFSTGSSGITVENREHLDGIAFIMKNHLNQRFLIIGYTDAVGDAQKNQRLSESRAKTAVEYLISKGIDPAQVSYLGLGERNPIATNQTAFGRRQNRRIEVLFNDGTRN